RSAGDGGELVTVEGLHDRVGQQAVDPADARDRGTAPHELLDLAAAQGLRHHAPLVLGVREEAVHGADEARILYFVALRCALEATDRCSSSHIGAQNGPGDVLVVGGDDYLGPVM